MNGRREEADETRIRQRWRTDNQNKNRGETKKCGERDEREQKREEADNGDGQRIKIKQWTEERQKSVGTICWRHITFSGMRGREMNGNWEEKKQTKPESDYGDGRRIKKTVWTEERQKNVEIAREREKEMEREERKEEAEETRIRLRWRTEN